LKQKICLVDFRAMTVNAFLQQPIRRLIERYDVYVALNLNQGKLLPGLEGLVNVLAGVHSFNTRTN